MSPTATMIAVVDSFAYQRARPATTSMYVIPTRTAVSVATGCEGDEYPSQGPIAVTLKGRGRAARLLRSGDQIDPLDSLVRRRPKVIEVASDLGVRSPSIASPWMSDCETYNGSTDAEV